MPIVIVVGAIAVVSVLGFVKIGRSSQPRTQIRGSLPTPSHEQPEPSPLQLLLMIERAGRTPKEWLVTQAVNEAYHQGDWRTAAAIASRYDISDVAQAPAESSLEAPTSPDHAADSGPAPSTIPDRFPSPVEGIREEDWSDFVKVMATDQPTAKTDKHVGIFHHRTDRLRQLKIDPASLVGDVQGQYHAFVTDCQDHLRHADVFRTLVATPVKIGADVHPITASGLLGLMKAAGPKNALHWIQHPEEQAQFPRTTELFLRCNGIF